MDNWIDALFKLMNRKKSNRGLLWASVIGLGVSAAAYGFKRKGNRKTEISLENVLDTFRSQNNGYKPAASGTAEIAEELTPAIKDLPKPE